MPKRAKELKPRAVDALKAEGRHAVGGVNGLYLRIVGGSRAWVLRAIVGSVRRDMGLGSYPEVSLAEARQRALEHRRTMRDGINPVEQRREDRERAKTEAGKAKTFKHCAEAFIEAHRVGWTNPKHAKQWQSTLENYAYPVMGETVVGAIDSELVLKVLKQPQADRDNRPLWECKNETADRVRNRVEQILDWAKFKRYREGDNPARWRGNLDNELPSPSKVQKVKHHPSLPYARVAEFMVDLRSREGVSVRALEFAILTAARSNEVRGARWSEIDLKAKVWTVPADRMKGRRGRIHRVPLSPPAVALLEALPSRDSGELVFPGPKGGPLSDAALSELLEGMHDAHKKAGGIGYLDPVQGKVAVPHGFRSSFKDWARAEAKSYNDEVSELALSHVNNDATRSAYARNELMDLRTEMMNEFADYCAPKKAGKVVDLNKHKRRAHK